nr:enediyne antibiotic chromoprotein [Kibdelosporangium sp. MJ126-NF4]
MKTILVAAATFGLLVTANSAASADAPTLTVTPSTDLVDGQSVAAAVSGFKAGATVFVSECAVVAPNTIACDAPNAVQLTTDASGNGSTSVTAHKSFTGYLGDGTPHGPVDCATVTGGCLIAAGDSDHVDGALAPITFQ